MKRPRCASIWRWPRRAVRSRACRLPGLPGPCNDRSVASSRSAAAWLEVLVIRFLAQLLILSWPCSLLPAQEATSFDPLGVQGLPAYNVDWDAPGPSALQSMPIGNGDIGLNVWVEEGGDVLFYIGKTD